MNGTWVNKKGVSDTADSLLCKYSKYSLTLMLFFNSLYVLHLLPSCWCISRYYGNWCRYSIYWLLYAAWTNESEFITCSMTVQIKKKKTIGITKLMVSSEVRITTSSEFWDRNTDKCVKGAGFTGRSTGMNTEISFIRMVSNWVSISSCSYIPPICFGIYTHLSLGARPHTRMLELPSKSQQRSGSECKSGKSAELSNHLVYLLRLGCLSLSSSIRLHSENKCMFLMSCTDFTLGTTPFLSQHVCVLVSLFAHKSKGQICLSS